MTGDRDFEHQQAGAAEEAFAPLPDRSTITLHDPTGVFVQVLAKLGCSIALSTDASRLLVIGAEESGQLTLSALVLPNLRGLAAEGPLIAAACAGAVWIYKALPGLGPVAPYAPGQFDAVYAPRAVHFTTPCDLHDMAFVGGSLVAVNTRFSCICKIDGIHSFTPIWKPPFITALRPGDRCHLNGMAIHRERLLYATMLAMTDEPQDWRRNLGAESGTLMECATGRVLADDLSWPHSPRVIGNRLYCLESGKGELITLDPDTGARATVAKLPGFTHGLAEYGGVLFVGLAKLRLRRPERPLPLEAERDSLVCGLAAIDLATHRVLGMIELQGGVAEVYDLQVLPGVRHADLRPAEQWAEHQPVETPTEAFWVSAPDRQPSA